MPKRKPAPLGRQDFDRHLATVEQRLEDAARDPNEDERVRAWLAALLAGSKAPADQQRERDRVSDARPVFEVYSQWE